MDRELKAYLDEWQATRRRDFAECIASLDAIHRSMGNTIGCVTAPVTATAELLLASAGLAEPSAPVPAIGEPPVIPHAAPIDVVPAPVTVSTTTTPAVTAGCIGGPVQLSSDSIELVSAPVGLAEPPVTVRIMEKSLVVAPAIPNATSTIAPGFCLTEGPSHDYTMPTPASTPAAAPTSHMGTVGVIPVLTAATAGEGTHDGEHIKEASPTAPTPTSKKSPATSSLSLMATADGVPLPLLPVPIPKPPWLLLGHELACAYLSCEFQKPTGAIHTICFSPLCHVTSIPMQKIVRNSELNLFLSTAPSFPLADQLDGGTVATYLNSDAVCTFCWCRIAQRTSNRVNYLLRYCGGHLHFIEPVREISILSQLPPWSLKKLTCFDNPNLSARECLLATPGVKKIAISLTAMGSLQLHFLVFSDNSEWWSNCWFPGCTYEPLSNGKYRECTACFILRWIWHGPGSGCLLWMVWYSVNEPYNSEESFEHYDTAMAFCPETVLMSRRQCQLFMFWLNFHVMQFGIQWQFSFISDKSKVAFDAFSDGPVKPFSQWLQTLVQQNYQDLDIILEIVCNLSAKIFKQTWYAGPSSVIYLLVAVSASVVQLWRVPWFSILFLDLTSEAPYGLVFFHWEIAWQLRTMDSERQCYYQVLIGMEMLDMQWLRWFAISVSSSYNTLVAEPVITEFHQLNLLYYYQTAKSQLVAVLELQRLMCKLCSDGTFQACKVLSFRKFSDPDPCQDFKARHLSYHVVQYIIHGVSHCGGISYSSFPICTGMRMEQAKRSVELIQWLANNYDGSDISTMNSLHGINKFFWVLMDLDGTANKHWTIQWDPGGYKFALCNSQKWQSTPELTHLHYPEELQWSSLVCACVSRIWLVAWDVDDLQFCTGCGQAPSQGGRTATDLGAFSVQVYVNHDYYIVIINQIHISYDFYLNQGYYFDTVCNTIIYYHEDLYGDSSKTKDGHMPWDPGRSVLRYDLRFRLGDKPSFKEGGMLGPSPAGPFIGLTWARDGGLGPAHSQLPIEGYNYWSRRKEQGIRLDQNDGGGGFLSHLGSDLPSPFMLFVVIRTSIPVSKSDS